MITTAVGPATFFLLGLNDYRLTRALQEYNTGIARAAAAVIDQISADVETNTKSLVSRVLL